MSASLSTVSEVRHDRGSVWRAIRADISLPGVFPPVHGGDALLVDGGVLNNLPIDVMATIVESGPIVASDLDQVEDRPPDDPFDVFLSGWRPLASRLGGGVPPVPRLMDVLVRSLSLSSTRNQRIRLAQRPVALHPALGRDRRAARLRGGPALVEPAYRHTLAALERHPIAVG